MNKHYTDIYKIDASNENYDSIMKKVTTSIKYKNVGFELGNIFIETIRDGNTVQISEVTLDKQWIRTLIHKNLKLDSLDQLVDLVLDYSEEKVLAMRKDESLLYGEVIQRLHDFNMKNLK